MKKSLLVVISILVLAVQACQVGGAQPMPVATSVVSAVNTNQQSLPVSGSVSQEQELLVALFQRVNPGVVAIKTIGDQAGSLGSGFVYDTEGHIVTNYHVVEGSKQVEVDFTSGFKAYGTIVGTNLDSDLAKEMVSHLVRLNEEGITVVMVTHDPAVAARAKRSGLLSDGRVVTGAA